MKRNMFWKEKGVKNKTNSNIMVSAVDPLINLLNRILIKSFRMFLILVSILISTKSFSQSKAPLLERNISITISNTKMDDALNKIAQQGGFVFSYNPALIDVNKTVSISVKNKTVREVLNQLFNGKMEYKTKGNYIILQKAKEQSVKPNVKDETFTISGYVTDENGEKLQWASVYNKKTLAAAITNEYGFYKINQNKTQPVVELTVSKQYYQDTVLKITNLNNQFLNVALTKFKTDTVKLVTSDSLFTSAELGATSIFVSAENEANTANIKDTLYVKAQVGVLPFVGTNGKLSGNVINDYSFNLFGGYSMGNRKLEVSTLFNIERSNVSGAQFAGFFNAVGGNVNGAQFSGFANTIKGSVTGFQGTGFVNAAWGNLNGVQAAGYVNVLRGKMHGAQLAGFVNTCIDTVRGFQGAGFVNYSNVYTKGVQLAGFVNVTINLVEGAQIGCVNYAKEVQGTQVGIFNYCKEIKGTPVGLLSYVKSGYHKFEISANEIFYTNVAFRSGVNHFHNIINVGIRPYDFADPLWTFGYGVGTTFKLSKKIGLDIDITSNQVVQNANFDALNLINKGFVGLDISLAKKFSLAFGVTVNGQLTDASYNGYPDIFTGYKPNIFYDHTYADSDLNLKMWMGASVALRFF